MLSKENSKLMERRTVLGVAVGAVAAVMAPLGVLAAPPTMFEQLLQSAKGAKVAKVTDPKPLYSITDNRNTEIGGIWITGPRGPVPFAGMYNHHREGPVVGVWLDNPAHRSISAALFGNMAGEGVLQLVDNAGNVVQLTASDLLALKKLLAKQG